MHISPNIKAVQPPVIQELHEAFTPDTLSLAQGVPFFPPPKKALSTLGRRLKEQKYHIYSGDAGLPELRWALTEKLREENGLELLAEQVMVTAGANQAFVNAALAVAEAGDEMILLAPYYFNHEMALRMLGIEPVIVPCGPDYLPDPQTVREAVGPRTRALVTISPNNPTGAVYPKALLQELNRLCGDLGIFHISDETYEYFTHREEPHHSPGAGTDYQNTINLYSFSKAYGMSGWRLGYMSYPAELHPELLKIQDTFVICASVASQLLGLECLKLGRAYLEPHLPRLRAARKVMLELAGDLEGLTGIPDASGGYYLYLQVDSLLSGREMAFHLLKRHDLAVVPGDAFGSTDGCYLRLSYGTVSPEDAGEGMRRLAAGIRELA